MLIVDASEKSKPRDDTIIEKGRYRSWGRSPPRR
jgi:hypothetical protein